MTPLAIFSRRIRGFRMINLVGMAVLIALAVGSYAFKTFAEARDADAANLESQIIQEQKRIRLLRAEVSHLEDPGRIERLSVQYLAMAPLDPTHETTLAALPAIAANPPPITPAKAPAS